MMPQVVGTKRSGADRWVGLQERGTPASLEVIAWIAERVGRRIARLLLYPITLYFVTTAHAARRASYEFLKRAGGRSVRWWHVLHHFYYFAATILDRVYLLRGEFDRFSITIHGEEMLRRQKEGSGGGILLGSHLGSFEVLRALGVMQGGFPLKVLMDTRHNQNISRFFDALNPTIAGTVIAPDRPDTLIKVRESLDQMRRIGFRTADDAGKEIEQVQPNAHTILVPLVPRVNLTDFLPVPHCHRRQTSRSYALERPRTCLPG